MRHTSKKLILVALSLSLFVIGAKQMHDQVAPSADRIQPLGVGETIPKAEVLTLQGEVARLDSLVKQQPSVLVFYRGGWCPYCNTQLAGLNEVFPALAEQGYQLFAISADRPERLAASIDKHSLDYTLLSDSESSASRAMGLAFQVDPKTVEMYREHEMDLESASGNSNHILPVPAVFLVNEDGVIQYSFVNPDYRVRLDSQELLMIADSLRHHSDDDR